MTKYKKECKKATQTLLKLFPNYRFCVSTRIHSKTETLEIDIQYTNLETKKYRRFRSRSRVINTLTPAESIDYAVREVIDKINTQIIDPTLAYQRRLDTIFNIEKATIAKDELSIDPNTGIITKKFIPGTREYTELVIQLYCKQ